jgi:hypothetical protein
MAKVKTPSAISLNKRPKVTRAGVHAKTKISKSKNSKNYRKSYKGQGR